MKGTKIRSNMGTRIRTVAACATRCASCCLQEGFRNFKKMAAPACGGSCVSK
jgi:hypothetical protein